MNVKAFVTECKALACLGSGLAGQVAAAAQWFQPLFGEGWPLGAGDAASDVQFSFVEESAEADKAVA